MTQILICTVGGSHQPIVSAIEELRPDFVVFVCSDNDPATGKPGSISHIEGKGSCIKAHPADAKPSLPNIPAQTGLTAEQYQITLTQADDLDRIYLDCKAAIEDIGRRFAEGNIVADYTGGTKSMSAGLVMAALEYPNVQLQIVTGSRADLIKVQDGSQFTAQANSEQIRFQRLIAPYQQAWTRYAFSEAEAGLKSLRPPADSALRGQYIRFRDLSRAFAEWDNFNHQEAHRILSNYASGPLAPYLQTVDLLVDEVVGSEVHIAKQQQKQEAARLLDLYRNAQRRVAQGRFDDAVARVYRLIEWTAQWLLQTKAGIDTGNIKPEQIPDNLTLTQNRDGQWQAGLFTAWQLVKYKTEGAAACFIAEQEHSMLNHIKIRNGSILAHGFEPIRAGEWQSLNAWLEGDFMAMLLAETSEVGIKRLPQQLPAAYQLPRNAFHLPG